MPRPKVKKNYSKRVVFFIDILGFKSIVESKKDNCDFIYKTLKNLQNINVQGIEFTHFSDSLIISFEEKTKSALKKVIELLSKTQINLIKEDTGILLRGAAAIGNAYHHDKIIFGPAVNKAYYRQEKMAVYPRIIVSKDIIERCSSFYDTKTLTRIINIASKLKGSTKSQRKDEEKAQIHKLLKTTEDGNFCHIDYISCKLDDTDYVNILKKMVRRGLRCNDDSIVSKYHWINMRLKIGQEILAKNAKYKAKKESKKLLKTDSSRS